MKFAILVVTGNILDAAKEQFINTALEIGCDYSIFDKNDVARLLLAKGFICPRDGNEIKMGRCRCGYSPKKRILNMLQYEAIRNLADSHKLGQRTGLVIMPTGSGKTRVAAEDAKRFGAKCLVYVAHTHEILDVANSELWRTMSAP
ncbi:MAG: DEAD/DEAH box helicase family protein [Candidatus Lindowbacteria bacterium]|nr:DEAD/DEAH box helicase family protein [Candidatus Lindowbacteria bacterium]